MNKPERLKNLEEVIKISYKDIISATKDTLIISRAGANSHYWELAKLEELLKYCLELEERLNKLETINNVTNSYTFREIDGWKLSVSMEVLKDQEPQRVFTLHKVNQERL